MTNASYKANYIRLLGILSLVMPLFIMADYTYRTVLASAGYIHSDYNVFVFVLVVVLFIGAYLLSLERK